jgi:hypothetical protein
MRLFHCSDEKHTTLTPQVGARRHDGQSAAAVGKAVVWLSNDSMSFVSYEGKVIPFRHEVEVADDDPNLTIDVKFEQGMKMAELYYKKPMPMRWYTYGGPLKVLSIAEYDATTNRCVPVQGQP